MRIIDADELKKMFPDKGEGAWTYNITAKAYIDAQPTIDKWHYPSRGELPTESGDYICAVSYYYEIKVETAYYIAEAEQWARMNTIIAWMPLPEPPKEREE